MPDEVQGVGHSRGCRVCNASQTWLLALGDPITLQTVGEVKQREDQSKPWLCTSQVTGLAPLGHHLYPKQRLYIKWFLLPKHVIAGPRQLVRQCLDRNDAVAHALLAFVKAPGLRTRTDREVGRLDKCPGQVLLPFFVLPSPFFLRLLSRLLSTQRQ